LTYQYRIEPSREVKNIRLSIKRKLKEAGLKKIHHSLRSVIPEFSHRIPPCDDTDCSKCQEHNQPIILTSTVHSLAYWMIRQLFAKKFQEKRKIHVLTNAYKKDLIDECQDLKRNLLTLITEIFSHKEANFTFVGDPKQNIMAFAGATDDIFQLLKEKFPDCVQKEISISFRVPEEIAVMANDFTRKFMSRRKPKLATNKTNGGKNPVVFLAGSEQVYQLTEEEENKIEEKLK
ncbi:10195_t:CDS:2, partial [Racocetra persica]